MKLVIFANATRGNQKANNITMMMTSKVATTGVCVLPDTPASRLGAQPCRAMP